MESTSHSLSVATLRAASSYRSLGALIGVERVLDCWVLGPTVKVSLKKAACAGKAKARSSKQWHKEIRKSPSPTTLAVVILHHFLYYRGRNKYLYYFGGSLV